MNKKLRATIALGCATACILAVGSFAFFTDRLTADVKESTAGNIDLVWADTSVNVPTDYAAGDFTGSNNEFAQDKVWDNTVGLVADGEIINPGDYFSLDYKLTNAGNKSIDVRQQLVLNSSVPMTADAEEYQLTLIEVDGSTAILDATVSNEGKTITYDLKDITINGEKEEETGAFTYADGAAYTVKLQFSKEAKNAFMDSTVKVDLYAAAKQHRNTDANDFPELTEMASIMTSDEWQTK